MPISVPTWYDLRGLGRSPISRLTVLVPVIGSFLLFSNATNELVSLSAEFLGLDEADAVQLSRRSAIFLYFGLLIFSFCTISYNILCPPVIKEFKTEYDFYEAELKIVTLGRANRTKKKLKEHFKDVTDFSFEITTIEGQETARAQALLNSETGDSREYWLKTKSAPVSDLLQLQYKLENESKDGQRKTIFGFYLFSFGLIAVPSVTTLLKVIKSLI